MVKEDVSSSWAESDLDSVGELLSSFEEFFSGFASEEELFGGEVSLDVGDGFAVFGES